MCDFIYEDHRLGLMLLFKGSQQNRFKILKSICILSIKYVSIWSKITIKFNDISE